MRSVWVSVAIALVLSVALPLLARLAGWTSLDAWYTGLPVGLLAGGGAFVLLQRWVASGVQAAMAEVQAIAARPPADEAAARAFLATMEGKLRAIRDRWGAWQPLLEETLDGQMGLLRYQAMDFEAARPLLARASSYDGPGNAAKACLAFRAGDAVTMDAAFTTSLEAAKDASVAQLWAVLALRQGRTDAALAACAKGLEKVPSHAGLQAMRDRIANKKPVSHLDLGPTWWQWFPDELKTWIEAASRSGDFDPAVVATLPSPIKEQAQTAMRQVAAAKKASQPRFKAARW
jgi:hypothetical protein